ncbi:nitrilase [Caldovatus sediminis]|uniref:Nitrilase n=1 Tax=Caldovatus sediminis TaxID=2041189 RepID=A0A8J2ZD63_9PROT|nr:carbon-nitrogen hydrolase family protein [Caldovatus sediminis]GGG39668.1 nitrilase [Caldovatus sediminis]
MTEYPALTVAAAHVASVYLDTDATIDKALDVIAEAARCGARLVVFPESFIPGFPIWVALAAPIHTHGLFKALAAQAIEVTGPQMARLRAAAKRHDIFVSIGFTEGTPVSVGCLWNSNVLIGPDGAILNHHRKLVPTYYEKLVWAPGDGAGLRVVETRIGRLGALICGENTNPLARYALMAQGEQLHIASFPPIWPTRVPGEAGAYDIDQAIRIRCGAHAFEAKCFVVVASGVLDARAKDLLAGLSPEAPRILEETPRAVSLVIGPNGLGLGQSRKEEGLLYADVDLAACVEPKQFHDVVGYYNRFDVFRLEVDRSARRPVVFRDGPEAPGEASTPPGAPQDWLEPA